MILVTGATGFLGSELVKQLSNSGKKVRALKRETSVVPPILEGLTDIEWLIGDMLDYFSLEKAFEEITHVYHCAALISFDPAYKKQLLKTNSESTAHIVNLCLENNVEKLIHVSSVSALGDAKEGAKISEQTQWEFNGRQHGYSISKYESEMQVWRGIAEGLNAVIVNPSLIIGPNAGTRGSGQLFEIVRNGLGFYTKGSVGLVDVEDVAKAMILLMDSSVSSERFLINALSMPSKELFEEAAKEFGIAAPSREAKPWMLELAWRGAEFLSLFTGKNYALTKDSARSSVKELNYANDKFLKLFPDFQYKPVKKSIEEICRKLKR